MILYSIGCPQCNVLKQMLINASLPFEEITDQDYMIARGFRESPLLEVDGEIYNFKDARDYIKKIQTERGN